MENYRILYRIRNEHDYFDSKKCSAVQCFLTPQGQDLLQRRGMIFRQTDVNEWTLLYNSEPDADNDILNFNLSLTDPNFFSYTEWKEFSPSAVYSLDLPYSKKMLDAATVIRKTENPRRIGQGFCVVTLKLTEKMLKSAASGKPITSVIHFCALSVKWEYVFIPRVDDVVSGNLSLDDDADILKFSSFKKCEIYGKSAWQTETAKPVPMRYAYSCKLRLMAHENGKQARILLSKVDPPVIGQYRDAPGDVLRQIYYY